MESTWVVIQLLAVQEVPEYLEAKYNKWEGKNCFGVCYFNCTHEVRAFSASETSPSLWRNKYYELKAPLVSLTTEMCVNSSTARSVSIFMMISAVFLDS